MSQGSIGFEGIDNDFEIQTLEFKMLDMKRQLLMIWR
jgi:hypothetical protein